MTWTAAITRSRSGISAGGHSLYLDLGWPFRSGGRRMHDALDDGSKFDDDQVIAMF